MYRAQITIRPKSGILDPQGQAVESALHSLEFNSVNNVSVGRIVELTIEDKGQVDQICRQLLANTLIEDYEIVCNPIETASP